MRLDPMMELLTREPMEQQLVDGVEQSWCTPDGGAVVADQGDPGHQTDAQAGYRARHLLAKVQENMAWTRLGPYQSTG